MRLRNFQKNKQLRENLSCHDAKGLRVNIFINRTTEIKCETNLHQTA